MRKVCEGQLSLFDCFHVEEKIDKNDVAMKESENIKIHSYDYLTAMNEDRVPVFKKEEIVLKNLFACQYTRECDKRKMIAFLGEMGNNLLYVKGFYTYHHIVEDNKKNRLSFEKDIENAQKCENDFEEICYEPSLKDMYKCREEGVWLYAEQGYAH